MFDLPHVASRIYGTPLLIARPKLEVILSVLGPKFQGEKLEGGRGVSPGSPQFQISEAGIAVLPILGTLVRRSSYLDAESGLCSYHGIADMASEAFAHPQVRGVLLEVDSCGGEAGGCFDLVEHLHTLSKTSGKPLWAAADENALSAGYALACAADTIYVARTGRVGSIGVVAVHVDESAADAKAGLAYTYIHAGAHKIDGNPHYPLSPEAHEAIQASVDTMYAYFVELAAKRRKCTAEAIRATEARVFGAQEGIAAGLADKVGTLQQAHDDLATQLDRQAPLPALIITSTSPKEISMNEPLSSGIPEGDSVAQQNSSVEPELHADDRQSPPPASGVQTVADPAALTAEIQKTMANRLAELNGVAQQARRLGVDVDPIQAFSDGVTASALREQVLAAAAERDQATAVITAHVMENGEKPATGGMLMEAVKKLCSQGGI